MTTLSVFGYDVEVYGTWAEANKYLMTSSRFFSTWSALNDEQRVRLLVDATRYLDRVSWKGTPTSPTQALAWPRTNATDGQGTAVGTSEIPAKIIEAAYILAGLLSANARLLGAPGGQIQSLREGPVAVSFFFSAQESAKAPGAVPEIDELVKGWTGASNGASEGSLLVPTVSGTDEESVFDTTDKYLITGGLA